MLHQNGDGEVIRMEKGSGIRALFYAFRNRPNRIYFDQTITNQMTPSATSRISPASDSILGLGAWFFKAWRWLSILLTAELSLLAINGLLALVYKKFVWEFDPGVHFSTLILAFLILHYVRKFNSSLDEKLPWESNLARRLGIQILGDLGITLFFTLPVRLVVQLIGTPFSDSGSFIRLQDEMMVSLVVSCFTIVVVMVDLGIFLMTQWKQSSTEAERVKKENVEFRFDRLRNQVNPHFLFNSLNTLASLVYNDPDTASRFVRQLAKVYRYVLENRDKEVIHLSEELNFMEAYLYLVKIRFDEGIEFELDLPTESQRKMIPPMTLQLLIENALKHNIVSASKPLKITIVASDQFLSVSNNIQPKLSPEPSTKTGLENIKSRYAFLTNQQVSIQTDNNQFRVQIPLLESESVENYR